MTASPVTPSSQTALRERRPQRSSLQPVISVVAPVFNEAETLPHLYQRLATVLESLGESFELILVDDGSSDESPAVLCRLAAGDSRVRVITFSRNFGHQIAISAGLDYARGRAG